MKYVAFYDLQEYADENRSAFPSACAVVSYMCEVFSSIEKVEIFSPVRTLNKKGIYNKRKLNINNNVSLKIPFSFGVKSGLGRAVAVLYTELWLLCQLLFFTSKGEIVVAYHSMSTIWVLKIIKKIKKVHLIEQVLEVYSDVNPMSDRRKKLEQSFFRFADGYICGTEIISQKINLRSKPCVIVPATYKSERVISEKYEDGDIHIVYAGTLRISKGGAVNAVNAMAFLPENYHLHIVGYGDEKEISYLNNSILCIKKTNPNAKISYDGLLRGEKFITYIQKCHIGLSTQSTEGIYSDSSFPSKVMTYLANGLNVLSVRIPAVETSKIGKYIYYYDSQEAKAIADGIMSIPIQSSNEVIGVLSQLHRGLISDVGHLFEKLTLIDYKKEEKDYE